MFLNRQKMNPIGVFGAENSGKTCIVERFVTKRFPLHLAGTLNAKSYSCEITVKNERINLGIFDVTGNAERQNEINYVLKECQVCHKNTKLKIKI